MKDEFETKGERREQKREKEKKRMDSGKRVKLIQQLIQLRAEKAKHLIP